jgi:catechol 2,3-dioxygenase-like lactoylglutathione lyase family enzyme
LQDRLVRMFGQPQMVLFSTDLPRAGVFYEALGFEEVFRTPLEGPPIHVDLVLDGYRIGLASEASAGRDRREAAGELAGPAPHRLGRGP